MPKIRIIPRMDIKNLNLVKTINLDGLRVVGDPNKIAINYYNNSADELLFLDTVASLYGRNNVGDIISKLSKNVFIPITVGGGIRSLKDAFSMFKSGADKIAVNTAAIENKVFLNRLSKEFGSQSIVISIDAKKMSDNKWRAFINNGRDDSGLDVVEWSKQAEDKGAGEILLTSVDNEGTYKGLDFNLFKNISAEVNIPIILGGGFSSLDDLERAKKMSVDALSISGALHYKKFTIKSIKQKL